MILLDLNESRDGRSLYEKLEENKQKDEQQLVDFFKLGNRIKMRDAVESEFFKEMQDEKERKEKEIKESEQKELASYREMRDKVGTSVDKKKDEETKPQERSHVVVKNAQKDLLKSVIKKRKVSDPKNAEKDTPVAKKPLIVDYPSDSD